MPCHVRQRVKRTIDEFAATPYPSGSIELASIAVANANTTAHRFKVEKWRIVYTVNLEEKVIDILAIRQRPPYDYGDITQLLERII